MFLLLSDYALILTLTAYNSNNDSIQSYGDYRTLIRSTTLRIDQNWRA